MSGLMSGRLADGSLDEMGTHRLLARAAPDEAAVESLRSVHLSLMLRERQTPNKVILVTSPSSGTGKAFVAANLAAVMAESGRRVLLIEADLHKPGLHRMVAIDEMTAGLTDLLSRSCDLEHVIHRHPSAGFDVMLQGSRQRKMGAALMSPVLEAAMIELRGRYDHIVINGAPISPTRDALVIGLYADTALMVVRAEQSLLAETRAALRRLEQSGIKLEGLLFNGVKRNRLNAPMVS
jgi:tyrosine-protein kinase Etk/Wzc